MGEEQNNNKINDNDVEFLRNLVLCKDMKVDVTSRTMDTSAQIWDNVRGIYINPTSLISETIDNNIIKNIKQLENNVNDLKVIILKIIEIPTIKSLINMTYDQNNIIKEDTSNSTR